MNLNATNAMIPGLRTGEKLGVFEVQEQLAAGGMGIVWKGYDRLLGRAVAIKQIADNTRIDESTRERFRREADIHKRLSQSHPNIVSIVDFIDDPRGLFIVMEYVDGPSLARVLSSGAPVEGVKALNILRDVAQGLSAIHAEGVVHRDLKPGNILLPSTGGAKVCDFGLATLMAEPESLESGTTQYMAPELFGGGPVDPRADIYSLGMVLYEMLAGRAAFDNAFKTIVRDERHEAMRWMKWHTNARIAAPPLSSLNDMVPPVLSDLVARMMAKDPTQRIASADELLEAVRRHFSKAAVTQAARAARQQQRAAATAHAAPGDDTGPATAPLPTRRRWPLVLAAVLGLLVLAGGGWLYFQGMEKQEQRQAVEAQADQQFNAAITRFNAENYAEARPMFEALAERWGEHPKLGVGSRGYALLCQARMQMAEAEALMLDGQYEQAAKLHNSVDATMSSAGALQLTAQASRLSELIDKLTSEAASRRAFNAMATEIGRHVAGGDFDAARRNHRRLTSLNAKAGSVNTTGEKRVLEDLGTRIEGQATNAQIDAIDHQAGQLADEERYADARVAVEAGLKRFPSSAKLQERLRRVSREIDYRAAMAAAQLAENKGDLATAVAQYQAANQITPDKAVNEKIAQLRSQLAFVEGQNFERQSNFPAAAAKYEQALSFFAHPQAQERLREMKLAGDKSSVLTAADTAAARGDFEQAAILFKKALDISPDPQTQQKLNEVIVRQHTKNADAALTRNEIDKARGELQAALSIKPDDGPAKAMLENLENVAKFNQLVATGDEARAQSDFGKAKKFYQAAMEQAKAANLNAEPARQKWTDTEYDHLVAQAKSSLEFGQFIQARGFLVTAQKMRSSEQVAGLLKEVEDHEANKR